MLRFLHALLQLRVVHRVVVVNASGNVADASRSAITTAESDVAVINRTVSFGVIPHAACFGRLQLRNVNRVSSIFTSGNVGDTALVSGRTYGDRIFFVCHRASTQRNAVISGSNRARANRNTVFTLRVSIYAIGVGLEVLGATGAYDIANTVFDIGDAGIQIRYLSIQVSNALGILGNLRVRYFQLTHVNRIGIRRPRCDVGDLTLTVFATYGEFTHRVLRCIHVVGGVASLSAASGLRTITHCNTVCMVGACVRTDSNTVDGICQNQSIQADTNTRITIDDSFRAHRQRVFPDSQ